MKKFFIFAFLVFTFVAFNDDVHAATSYDIFGSISETQKSVLDEYGKPVYSTCPNSYVTMDIFGGIQGWRSCDYSYSGSTDRLPNSFIWWFRNFQYTKGTNWEVNFRIYGSNLEFDFEHQLPNVTVTTDYGSETCSVKYGGYYYLDVSCVGTSTSLFAITLWQESIPILPTGFYVLSNHYSNIKTDLDNSYIINNQNQNTQNLINNQNQNSQNIINNQNQNQQQTNQNLGNINNSLNDDSGVPKNDVSDKTNEWASKLAGTGPVSNMVLMPITLLNGYINGFNSTCSPYNLGNLMGTDIILPCINISNYLGATLWNVIDVLFSGFMIYAIGKKFVKIFNDFTNLRDNQMNDLYGGGN